MFRSLVLASLLLALGCTPALTPAPAATAALPSETVVKLPPPRLKSTISLEETLYARRSVRDFADTPLTLSDVSQLLWAAQGTTAPGRRTAPSAGALYPLETYVAAGRVDGLAAGVYRYRTEGHELVRVTDGDTRGQLASAALGQVSIREAPLVIVMSGVYERTAARYGDRGQRYVHLEAGHAAQNVCLQAVGLGLAAVTVGAFDDAGVKVAARMAPAETPLYLIPVGRAR